MDGVEKNKGSRDIKGQLHTRIQLQVNEQTETRKKIPMSLTQRQMQCR